MSRLINPDSAGKDRTRLSKAIVLAVRELARQTEVTQEAKDLAAFASDALDAGADGISIFHYGAMEEDDFEAVRTLKA